MKKFFVITVLFALPLVAYLFFASGVNNFARLPVLNSEIYPLQEFTSLDGNQHSFEGNITILSFPGKDPMAFLTNAYHLGEKIYDPYSGFNDLYFVSVVPQGSEEGVAALKEELRTFIDLDKWIFVTGTEAEVKKLFDSLGSHLELSEDYASPNAFIIDKNAKLRGRTEDKDQGKMYGYDTASIAVMNNKMDDDVKVILAEYRLELKKYKEIKEKE